MKTVIIVQLGYQGCRYNTVERMMKPIYLGRNNYLFCGSELGATNASLFYSFIETCKMNEIRPVKYIADVLRKLESGETNYEALLPGNYSAKNQIGQG